MKPVVPFARLTIVVLLAACAGASAGGESAQPGPMPGNMNVAAADTLPPCLVPIQGISSWRTLTGPGFSVCLPADWRRATPRDRTAAQGARWEGGRDRTFEWGGGPFARGPGQAMPYNDMRQQDLRIGARQGRLDLLGVGNTVTYIAWFAADTMAGLPALKLAGFADGPDARQQVQVIFQSLRPAP